MIAQHEIIFGGTSSKTFGVVITGSGTFNAPARDVERVSIPGRNGDLLFDNGRYENITVTYPAAITKDFDSNIAALRAYLLSKTSYTRLEDSYHPDEYRMGIFTGAFETEAGALNEWGHFDLSFDCKPQRFLKSGEKYTSIASGATVTLNNPTLFPAKPLIIVGKTGSITVGNQKINIQSMPVSQIHIDCETMNAYLGSSNRNDCISVGTWPTLPPGSGAIKNETGGAIGVYPRWWRL